MTHTECPFKNLEDSAGDRERDAGLRKSFCFIVFQEAGDCLVLPS